MEKVNGITEFLKKCKEKTISFLLTHSNMLNDENDIEDIKKQIGSLTNIPYDLTFELNNPNKIGYNFVGGILINPKWKPDVKREIRSYIG